MNPIHIISASAGSGKTYRLSESLKESVLSEEVRPEAVVATTFTRKAAAELQERVRQHLVKAGQVDAAHRLTAARMGTVNSVCGQMVSEFCFELGLSPELGVLDNDAAKLAIKRSLSSVLDAETESRLSGLADRFDEWDWQGVVENIVSFTRTNNMSTEDLPTFAKRSRDGFMALLGETHGTAADMNRRLKEEVDLFLAAVDTDVDRTGNTRKYVQAARAATRKLNAGQTPPWSVWAKLAHAETGAKSRELVTGVRTAAAGYDVHPQLRQDTIDAIDLVFDLARATLERYQRDKAEQGVIDFVDQERFALELLDDDEVRARLAERIDLVLVDEFQDTSPIQLAIFLKLAQIAPHSTWVGDQKQAIFGFRGTDPALMDAAITQIMLGEAPEMLEKSWRSRPPLVEITSDLFAPPFAATGIPEQRTRLVPALEELDKEKEKLGNVAEYWQLKTRNQGDDARAVADALKQMLADRTVKVRDPLTGDVRQAKPGDVAILCRVNKACVAVASALAEMGIPAHLARRGLFATPEGQLLMAGLRLWADPSDTLAQAELARLVTFPENPNGWLTAIVQNPGRDAFSGDVLVAGIHAAREAQPTLEPLSVFDTLVQQLDMRELCHRLGSPAGRIANIEAFRAHVNAYCDRDGGATVAGLVAYLYQLVVDELDHQGVAGAEDAVTVCTWHASKGLEWPITVLFELAGKSYELAALGVHVESDREKLDLENPLAERWLRYWPNPFGRVRKHVTVLDRLVQHAVSGLHRDRERREQLRVLYVGWTRARDRVVLACRPGELERGRLSLLNPDEDQQVVAQPDGDRFDWAGTQFDVTVREGNLTAAESVQHGADPDYPEPVSKTWPRAFIQPSSATGEGNVGAPIEIGPRIALDGQPPWDRLGNAIHGFLAADREHYESSLRTEIATRQLQSWNVDTFISVQDVLDASDRFQKWVTQQWPNATWMREWPVQMVAGDGSLVRGQVDLVLRQDDQLVVIDHKSFPGTVEQAIEKAGGFGGQVAIYEQAVGRAVGVPVTRCFIHLPVTGILLPVNTGLAGSLCDAWFGGH